LAITRQLLELHGSKITVKSEMGKGSSFFFTLPVSLEKPSVKPGGVSESNEILPRIRLQDKSDSVNENSSVGYDKAQLKGIFNIMIVDDDPINIQVLANHLSLMNYNVKKAVNGMEALEFLKQNDIWDLILLDVMMPRLSGYEVCKNVREKYSANELPIIMLTAKNLVSDLVTGFESGANDYIVKPFEKRELLARVNTALRLKHAYKEHNELLEISKELDIAEMVQKKILTNEKYYHNINGLEIDVKYLPMNKKVGGDYYNISKINDNITSIIIADATGHGIQAALSTMQIDIILKQIYDIKNANERFEYINDFLIRETESKNFFTAFMIDINTCMNENIKGKIRYSAAGHPAQILIKNKDHDIKLLKTKGLPIGVVKDVNYQISEEEVAPGDLLFVFTDGIYEEFNKNRDEFGENRLLELLKEETKNDFKKRPMSEINQSIINAVKIFLQDEEFNDDITLIGIRIKE